MQNDGIIFFTCTCLNWKPLLENDIRKSIIIKSLEFLVKENRIWLYAFVIMPNHLHLIWRKQAAWVEKDVQQQFLKYTAQQFKFHLMDTCAEELNEYRSTQSDRQYHFWERRPFKAEIFNRKVGFQKLEYIHQNPVRVNLCQVPTDYPFSSARYYEQNKDDWGILTHLIDHL